MCEHWKNADLNGDGCSFDWLPIHMPIRKPQAKCITTNEWDWDKEKEKKIVPTFMNGMRSAHESEQHLMNS